MTTRTSRPISGSAVAGSAPADIVDIAGGYFAEKRADGFAIRHERGGLHMALPPEIAMVNAIAALRAELKELDALKVDIANVLTDLTDCSIENDALRARVAELEQDAARYGFLNSDFSPMGLNIEGNHVWAYRRNATLKGPTLDAAIDAAMKE